MAEIPSWQKQSMSKNGGCSAPTQMNPKLLPTGAAAGLHKKIATPSFGMGGVVGTMTAGKTVRKFADGTPGGVKFDQGEFAGVDAAVAKNESESGEWARGENYGDGTTGQERVDAAKATTAPSRSMATDAEVRAAADEGAAMPKSFKEAFAENRKAGNKTFEWGGKTITTELASEKPSKTAARPVVSSSPAASKSFAEDVEERKANRVQNAMTRNENYGNEGRRQAQVVKPRGKGVIDTSNIDSKTLLPRR
jgi:hypothetical protein